MLLISLLYGVNFVIMICKFQLLFLHFLHTFSKFLVCYSITSNEKSTIQAQGLSQWSTRNKGYSYHFCAAVPLLSVDIPEWTCGCRPVSFPSLPSSVRSFFQFLNWKSAIICLGQVLRAVWISNVHDVWSREEFRLQWNSIFLLSSNKTNSTGLSIGGHTVTHLFETIFVRIFATS